MLSRFALMAGEPADNGAHHAHLSLSMPYRIWCGMPYLSYPLPIVWGYRSTGVQKIIMKILATSTPSTPSSDARRVS